MRAETTDDASSLRIELRGHTHPVTRVGAAIWAAGWLATETAAVSQGLHNGLTVGTFVFIAMWTVIGAFVLFAVAWAAAGMPEVIGVSGPTLQICRAVGPLVRSRRFDVSTVRALRVLASRPPLAADYAAIRAFWDRGAGRIVFDVDGRSYGFGSSVDDATADDVVAAIAARLPGATVQPEGCDPDTPRARRHRRGWAGYFTSWVLVGGLMVPIRTAIIDLPVCTGGALGGEYEPISINELHGDGQVLLVPFDDFPVDAAEGIADHFRSRFGVPISVASSIPLPEDVVDQERRQADSEVLLSALERTFHEAGDTVVIGLTSADMFIPGVNWAYAFSNRREPRLAVVSPFRMDRGCLGIREASVDTQLARLRKMVGKNIGVLFYRLPLSSHPRSMMYYSIGGPQELDTMRDEY